MKISIEFESADESPFDRVEFTVQPDAGWAEAVSRFIDAGSFMNSGPIGIIEDWIDSEVIQVFELQQVIENEKTENPSE